MSSIFLFSTSRIFLPNIYAQPFHALCRMCKKHPVRRTQLIQPRLSIHKRLAPSAAAASAQGKMRTFLTGCTDRSGSLHKCFCFFRSFHLYKSIVHGSQFPRIHAIKITRIHTSVSFYHKITITAAVPLPDILLPSVPDWKTYEYPSPPLRQNPHTTDRTARTEIFHTAPVPPHKCCAPASHPAV